MSSQDVIMYKVLLLIFYIIPSATVDISVFISLKNSYLQVLSHGAFSFGYCDVGGGARSASLTSHQNVLPSHLSFSRGPIEFEPIMDNNHITARYIKDRAYCSAGSHSGTFQKSIHSRALTGNMLCIKCVT